jgi:hypothetical protein
MTKSRNLLIAVLACAAALAVAAPAAAKSQRLYTADRGGADGQTAGHARYTTKPFVPQRTLVALKACDTDEDGYGIVVTIWQRDGILGRRQTVDEFANRKGVFTCSKKRVYRLPGIVELRVCAHDEDDNVGSNRFGYVSCSPITRIAGSE